MSILNPVKPLTDAIMAPFQFIFVVGLCAFINWFTTPGHWWVQWVAFGMGIAWIVAWARAFKFLVVTVGVAAISYFLYRWWQNRSQPEAAQRALAEVKSMRGNTSAV
jgi:hypothetical protein